MAGPNPGNKEARKLLVRTQCSEAGAAGSVYATENLRMLQSRRDPQGEYYANVTRGRKLSVQVVSPVAQGEGLAEEEGQQLPVSIAFGVAVRPNGRLAKVRDFSCACGKHIPETKHFETCLAEHVEACKWARGDFGGRSPQESVALVRQLARQQDPGTKRHCEYFARKLASYMARAVQAGGLQGTVEQGVPSSAQAQVWLDKLKKK